GVDELDMISDKAFPYRFNDRNSACDRRLKKDRHSFFGCLFENLSTSFSFQRLVPGNDDLARIESPHCEEVRNVNPAHQFDEDIDLRVIDQFLPIPGDCLWRSRNRAFLFRVSYGDPMDR